LYHKRPGLKEGMWANAHMYYGMGLPEAEGAGRWFTQCCLPVIKRMRPVPVQRKIKQSFNLHADGGPDTLVVGVGQTEFQGGGPAVFLIFASGKGMPIAVPATKEVAANLQPGEFFIKDWGDKEEIAKRLVQAGLVRILVDKPKVQLAHAQLSTAVLVEDQLTSFSQEELARYKP
jgi:hypothetical protein